MLLEFKTTPKVKQVRLEFPVFKQTFRLTMQTYRSPDTWTQGIGSRCIDGKHILFFDYDKMPLSEIKDEIKYLQETFQLSNAYIFEIEKNASYHVVILDKFSLRRAFNILNQSNVEWSYRNSVLLVRGREWVLRTIAKGNRNPPRFLQVLYSKYNFREISTAHKCFLQNPFSANVKEGENCIELLRKYKVPKIFYPREDNISIIPLINYNTGNRVD